MSYLLEVEAELTWEDRIRRWGRRVWAALRGEKCPGCEAKARQVVGLHDQLADERLKYTRLRDLRESEPVPKVTEVDIAAAYDTFLPEQRPRRLVPRQVQQAAVPYRPPTTLERAQRRNRAKAALANRAPTNADIAARAARGPGKEAPDVASAE